MQKNSIVSELVSDIRKFSVYRTANKLISLKEMLRTDHIPYKLVLSILEIYRLNSHVIEHQEINKEKLENIIHDTFFAAEKQGHFTNASGIQSIDSVIRSVTEYILQIFNPNTILQNNTEKSVRLYDLKQALLILCKDSNQEDLIYEHFILNCDHNHCVTRYRLKEMLTKVAHILSHVDREFDMDDWHQSNVIDDWFAKCPGIVGLNEYQFTSFWVESKSIFRNYAQLMAISQRIMDTKDIVHHIECSLCKTDIKGLRFECTICYDYSLCFQCFCVDTNTEDHTISHRLGDGHFVNKRRLLFKKCWNVLGCRTGSFRCIQSIGMTTVKTNFDEFRHEFATITNQNVSMQRPVLSRRNSHQIECKLSSIIGVILSENEKLSSHLSELETNDNSNSGPTKKLIKSHMEALKAIVTQLEEYSIKTCLCWESNPDIFGGRPVRSLLSQPVLRGEHATIIDTDMQNFTELLHIVKDIIEDTYSDNTELSKATNQLENILDTIIEGEERKGNK